MNKIIDGKKKILFYSDCYFFAGCENMIANFLKSESLNNKFDISLLYIYSKEYETGLQDRVGNLNNIFHINLLNYINIHLWFKNKIKNNNIRKFISAPILFLFKYIFIFYNVKPIYNHFKKLKPDIIHINNGGYPGATSCYSALIAAKLLSVKKIIYVVNNIAVNYKSPFRWIDYILDNITKKWVSYYVTGSKYANQQLKKILNCQKGQLQVINNGIAQRAITENKIEFYQNHNIPLNKILISTIANFEQRKGHVYLVYAIEILKNEKPQLELPTFIFEGVGEEFEYIKNIVIEKKLEKNILLIGHSKNIFNLINASDIIILPSISNEDFPNVIIEAMLFGKPVIGTTISGIPEQIIHNKTGILVKPKSSREIVNAIIKMMENSIRVEMGKNAEIEFKNNYTVEKSINKYINLYNS